MLRITQLPRGENGTCIKLEGKLFQPWVDEVRDLFVAADAVPLPRLDLAGITFVDTAGAELLRELLRRGVQVESCVPYVAELLHLEREQNR